MPFSVAGVLGTSDGDWSHTALTWSLCEFAALMCDIFGPACEPSGSAADKVKLLCQRMQHWLLVDFPALFGVAQRPKLHKFIAHLYDAILLRGNFKDGDTGLNEALHKAIKKAWMRTNKRQGETALQLIMAEQVATSVCRYLNSQVHRQGELAAADGVDPAGKEQVAEDETGSVDGSDIERGASCAGRAPGAGARRKRQYGLLRTPARLAVDLNLPGVAATLGVDARVPVRFREAVVLAHVPLRFDGRWQIARAAKDFYGGPHYSWVLYRDGGGRQLYRR